MGSLRGRVSLGMTIKSPHSDGPNHGQASKTWFDAMSRMGEGGAFHDGPTSVKASKVDQTWKELAETLSLKIVTCGRHEGLDEIDKGDRLEDSEVPIPSFQALRGG